METIDDLLSRHPFFKGLKPEYLALIAGCGQNVHFDAGAYLLREGEAADRFFAIRGGSVAVETYVPSRGAGHAPDAWRGRDPGLVVAVPALRVPVRCPCAGGRSRHGVRRRLPADQVRRRSGSRLRTHETPGTSGLQSAGGHQAPTPRRVWSRPQPDSAALLPRPFRVTRSPA